MKKRCTKITRNTFETQIDLSLNVDGTGKRQIDVPNGFLFHMLDLFSKHGLLDLNVTAKGDTFIDEHHTVEDIGIVLGQAFYEVLGEKRGINRYGFFVLPMDEVLVTAAIDFSGRYAFTLDCEFKREMVGDMSTEMVYDFWDAFAQNAKANVYIKVEYGRNDHHKIEGIFKAMARAIRVACEYDSLALDQVPSTKGSL
jgi:imidazoleglycerol phosphate dehydratase HisB